MTLASKVCGYLPSVACKANGQYFTWGALDGERVQTIQNGRKKRTVALDYRPLCLFEFEPFLGVRKA